MRELVGSRLKVCIITSWFPSHSHPNRAPFVLNFARNLSESGVDVSVITCLEDGDQKLSKEGQIVIHRIKIQHAFSEMLRIISSISPDVLHVHAPNVFAAPSILVARLRGIPIVATVHRAEVDKVSPPISIIRRLILRQFHKIIAVSMFTRKLALQAGAPENKIAVIYNSCDEGHFYPSLQGKTKRLINIDPRRKVVLFAGNLIRIKGVYTLIEALRLLKSQIPDILFVIVGKGEERESLEAIVKQNSLENNVIFVGWLPQAELSTYYNAADIFVLPSSTEGHSVALLEAMSTGVPIIASNVGGNIESIENGVNGYLFENGNAADLAAKIQLLLQNPDLCCKMSDGGRQVYAEKFGAKTQIEKHLAIYSSVMRSRNTSNQKNVLLLDNSGLSHYTAYLSRGLSKSNKVHLWGFSREEFEITGAARENVKFHQAPIKTGERLVNSIVLRPFSILLSLIRIILRSDAYDVFHVQGHLPMFFLLIPYLKLRRKKIIVTIHDVVLRASGNGIRGKLELFYVNSLAQPKLLLRAADHVLVHGNGLKEKLESMGVPPNKITVIPHFDYRYLLEQQSEHSSGMTSKYALVFGRIKPYKGIDVLVKAARIVRESVKDFNILIAGKGDVSYFDQLLNEEDRQFIRIRNEFIPNSEIPSLMDGAKYLVLPYTDASQSGVIPLAYTFRKTMVASDVGSLGETVEHGKTGFLFKQGEVNELARLIITLEQKEPLASSMGAAGYEKLMSEFSLERTCEIIDELYR